LRSNPLWGITRGWTEIRSVSERIPRGRARLRVGFYDSNVHVAVSRLYAAGGGGHRESRRPARAIAIRTASSVEASARWRQAHYLGSIDDPHSSLPPRKLFAEGLARRASRLLAGPRSASTWDFVRPERTAAALKQVVPGLAHVYRLSWRDKSRRAVSFGRQSKSAGRRGVAPGHTETGKRASSKAVRESDATGGSGTWGRRQSRTGRKRDHG